MPRSIALPKSLIDWSQSPQEAAAMARQLTTDQLRGARGQEMKEAAN
jgi:hypothetical protein